MKFLNFLKGMKDRGNGLRVFAVAMAFGMVLSPLAIYAQRGGEFARGKAQDKSLGKLKNDQKTSDMLEELIGEEAALRRGKPRDVADRQYERYAKKLAKMLDQFDAAQQQEIFYGSGK